MGISSPGSGRRTHGQATEPQRTVGTVQGPSDSGCCRLGEVCHVPSALFSMYSQGHCMPSSHDGRSGPDTPSQCKDLITLDHLYITLGRRVLGKPVKTGRSPHMLRHHSVRHIRNRHEYQWHNERWLFGVAKVNIRGFEPSRVWDVQRGTTFAAGILLRGTIGAILRYLGLFDSLAGAVDTAI